jgi:hypothetical protein
MTSTGLDREVWIACCKTIGRSSRRSPLLPLQVPIKGLLVLAFDLGLQKAEQVFQICEPLALSSAWAFQRGPPNLVCSVAGLPQAQQIG